MPANVTKAAPAAPAAHEEPQQVPACARSPRFSRRDTFEYFAHWIGDKATRAG